MTTATRTRHAAEPLTRNALRAELLRITGSTLVEVRITRPRWDDRLHWVAMALAVSRRSPATRREVPLAEGGQHREIGLLLRDAFPHADWSAAQDYDVVGGILTEHVTRVPACLRGDEL
ncbi:hypothetical protein ABZU94_10705 [Streptomyces mirabilis]|uniref:hypothetical protein n=1 Tax=Streptomyces sp. NPDC005388 TaxID=3156717 RepID=UPI0033B2FD8B